MYQTSLCLTEFEQGICIQKLLPLFRAIQLTVAVTDVGFVLPAIRTSLVGCAAWWLCRCLTLVSIRCCQLALRISMARQIIAMRYTQEGYTAPGSLPPRLPHPWSHSPMVPPGAPDVPSHRLYIDLTSAVSVLDLRIAKGKAARHTLKFAIQTLYPEQDCETSGCNL